MSKKAVDEIQASIKHISYQIGLLKSKINHSEEASIRFNRLIVQRACLRKRLTDLQSGSKILNLFKNFKIQSKEKNICDYFQTR